MELIFSVPGRPHGKARPFFTGKRAITPSSTRAYETTVQWCATQAMRSEGYAQAVDAPCRVWLILDFAVPKSASKKQREECLNGRIVPVCKPDADNCAKALLDGMNGIVYADDRQVFQLSVAKRYWSEDKVEVLVEW
ncbi:MAG TPA: RusA family crossover junction endodeoxyribonuclease [Succinivibrionaceae bacterium]|nr:RusA family crossover junction endodeoxyribonuclease [Succinivibrionaceae bacterium]